MSLVAKPALLQSATPPSGCFTDRLARGGRLVKHGVPWIGYAYQAYSFDVEPTKLR